MNNKLFLAICIFTMCFSCNKGEEETRYTTSATIRLVNETSVVIKSDDILGYVIQPGETLIHTESHTNECEEKPTIDTYDPFATNNTLFIYGDNSRCELGLNKIENYENRKGISSLKFEFTFRFTEEKQAQASPCNI